MEDYKDFDLDLKITSQSEEYEDVASVITTTVTTHTCARTCNCTRKCKVPTLGKTKIPAASCHKKGCGLAQIRC
ncbi:hypothetical protein AXF21_04185 [Eubacterium minutum ATCC 700079]|nr:hypothetical protein AXF21_04185 [Eubacterium minutum ATCC 700079]